jgi:hypothetical protein
VWDSLWKFLSDNQKKDIYELALRCDLAVLKERLDNHIVECNLIDRLLVPELRKLAQEYGIADYKFMPKMILLGTIKGRMESEKAKDLRDLEAGGNQSVGTGYTEGSEDHLS